LRKIQTLLQKTGDLKGRVDGVFGAQTRQAIIDFERRLKNTATGWPTEKLAEQISKNLFPAPNEKVLPFFERYLYNPRFWHYKAFALDPKTGILQMQ